MSKKIICVVEDNTPIRKLFVTLLKKAGYETQDFPDGGSFLKWIAGNTPDIILLDILLPDANGSEILAQIKNLEHLKSAKFVAVTGFATAGDRSKFLEQGFDSYISKPINTATFVEEISELFTNE